MLSAIEEDNESLSPYELQRLERVKKNEEHLKSLGLYKYAGLMRKKNKSPASSTKTSSISQIKPGEERRSRRLASNKGKGDDRLLMLDYSADDEKVVTIQDDDEDDDANDEVVVSSYYNKKSRKKMSIVTNNEWKLSEQERESLSKVDDNYLDKFQEFLEYHDRISEQNVRNVMKQARKLASGEGIRYESPCYGWAEGCYFKKGVKITPISDFIELMKEGQDCEDRYGRDHGNGWLISHPLKKLLLFQQFILNNPSFLNSKAKLKDYCGGSNDDDDAYNVARNSDTGKNLSTKKQKQGKKKMTLVPKKLGMTDDSKANFVGRRIAKDFVDGKIYFGTVDTYCPKNRYWHVSYDDGDSEEFGREEITSILFHYKKNEKHDGVLLNSKKKHSAMATSTKNCTRKRMNPNGFVTRKKKHVKVNAVTP